jgi:hypothetical protein
MRPRARLFVLARSAGLRFLAEALAVWFNVFS